MTSPYPRSPQYIPDVVLSAHLNGETVLLHMDTKQYYHLNETGQRIWTLLEEGNEPSAILDTLVREFEVDRATADREVQSLFAMLRKNDLLRHTDPS